MSEYVKLNSDVSDKYITQIVELWRTFMKNTGPKYDERFGSSESKRVSTMNVDELYDVNLFALKECFEKVHQREDYFKRYHDRLKMSDFKEIGLIAFWLTKFKPFHLNKDLFRDAFAMRINEQFALYFIFNAVSRYANEQETNCNVERINSDLYNELLYTMQYRDLSKEAFGCIVELIYLAIKNKD